MNEGASTSGSKRARVEADNDDAGEEGSVLCDSVASCHQSVSIVPDGDGEYVAIRMKTSKYTELAMKERKKEQKAADRKETATRMAEEVATRFRKKGQHVHLLKLPWPTG